MPNGTLITTKSAVKYCFFNMFGSKIHKWTLLTFKKDVGLALETFLGIYSFNQSERLLKSEVNNEVGFSKKFRKAWFKLIPPQYSSDW